MTPGDDAVHAILTGHATRTTNGTHAIYTLCSDGSDDKKSIRSGPHDEGRAITCSRCRERAKELRP